MIKKRTKIKKNKFLVDYLRRILINNYKHFNKSKNKTKNKSNL